MMVSATALAQGKGNAEAGKAVYDYKCKKCHGTNGEGNAALAKSWKVTFPDFRSKELQRKTDADLKKVVAEGKGKMLPPKDLSDQQVEDVIAFLRSLAKP